MVSRVANLGDFSPKNANFGIFWPLGNWGIFWGNFMYFWGILGENF
jgi:hypothetical protein